MLLSYNRLVLKYIGKCCFILLQRAKPPTMGTSATKNFATKRLQILNRHALNICRNKTSVIKGKKQNKKSPLQKNKGVSPDKIDTIRQVPFVLPFKAAERKVIIK